MHNPKFQEDVLSISLGIAALRKMSDLSINSSKFSPDAIPIEHKRLMALIRQMPRDQPWWEVNFAVRVIHI